jgi:L-asparagine transporter-like permease
MKEKFDTVLIKKGICSLILIVIGIILNVFIETKEFGFKSVGSYLICIGILFLIILAFYRFLHKDNIIDERTYLIANKTGKLLYALFILSAFIIMIIDGINPINIPYYVMMTYFIMGSTIFGMIIYHIFSKYN